MFCYQFFYPKFKEFQNCNLLLCQRKKMWRLSLPAGTRWEKYLFSKQKFPTYFLNQARQIANRKNMGTHYIHIKLSENKGRSREGYIAQQAIFKFNENKFKSSLKNIRLKQIRMILTKSTTLISNIATKLCFSL